MKSLDKIRTLPGRNCFAAAILNTRLAQAARLKDIAREGVRENILIGYGIVVGLVVRATRPRKSPDNRSVGCLENWG